MIIRTSRKADKSLSKLDNITRQRLLNGIKPLLNWPDVQNVKSLTGNYKGFYRLRIGDWRILFEVNGNIIDIAEVVNRKEAY